MTRKMVRQVAFLVGLSAAFLSSLAKAEKKYDPGASDTEIKIGNIVPYSGPASAYGMIGKVEAAYFKMINDQGGINGRKINFISYDDAYSPPKTVEQARRLVESDEVLLIFSAQGTPTNSAIQRYLNNKKIPHLFISSGATKWDDPKNYPWSMGHGPTYQNEGIILGKYILQEKPDAKVAILYQNDDFGKDFTKHLHHLVMSQSTSIGAVITPAGFNNARGLVSATYFKDVTDPQWKDDPGMQRFLNFMDRYMPGVDKADSILLLGYGKAQTLERVLRQCGDELTRENVMRQAANLTNVELDVLLPGITVNTSPTKYSPVDQMHLMRFNGEKWELFGELLQGSNKR